MKRSKFHKKATFEQILPLALPPSFGKRSWPPA